MTSNTMTVGQVWKCVRKNPNEVTVIVLIEPHGYHDWIVLLLDDWRDSKYSSPRRVGSTCRWSIHEEYGWQRVT